MTQCIHLEYERFSFDNENPISFPFLVLPAALLSIHTAKGDFHDQGDAKWIVIRRSLWGHNDTPCGRSAPGHPGSGCPQGVIGVF
jgi:hypothetical protein